MKTIMLFSLLHFSISCSVQYFSWLEDIRDQKIYSRWQLNCYYLFRCTNIIATPSLYVDLIASAKKLDITLPALKVGSVGGALCTQEIVQGMMDTLNIRRVCVSQGDLLL